MSNVGIVIVSHSPKVAEGAADMVRQMVGNAVPLAWTGGDIDGGLGTNVAGILEAIETAWSPAGVAILVDLGAQSGKGSRDPALYREVMGEMVLGARDRLAGTGDPRQPRFQRPGQRDGVHAELGDLHSGTRASCTNSNSSECR